MNLNDSEDAYNKVYADEPHHKKSWTHELVAAAAGFAGKSHLQNKKSRQNKSTRACKEYIPFLIQCIRLCSNISKSSKFIFLVILKTFVLLI